MQPVQPRSNHGSTDMQPVNHRSSRRVLQIKYARNPDEHQPGHQHANANREEGISDSHRPPISAAPSVPRVDNAKDHKRHDNQQPQNQMPEKHQKIEIVLIGFAREPFQSRHAGQISRVCSDQSQQSKHDVQQPAQPRTDRLDHFWYRRRSFGLMLQFVHGRSLSGQSSNFVRPVS